MTIPHWERCSPWLQAALDHAGERTLVDAQGCIVRGEAQFWPGERSAVVTEIIGDTINGWLAGGDMHEIIGLLPGIEAFGRVWGASYAEIFKGRKGWARALRPHGYTPHGEGVRKEL